MAIAENDEFSDRKYWAKINQALVEKQQFLENNLLVDAQTQTHTCNLFDLLLPYEDNQQSPVLGTFFMLRKNENNRTRMSITTCDQLGKRRTINISLNSKVPELLYTKRRPAGNMKGSPDSIGQDTKKPSIVTQRSPQL